MSSARYLLIWTFVGILAAACADTTADVDAASAQEAPVVIDNVTVVPLDRERVIPEQTILVQDGVIAEIGDAGEVEEPEGAIRIDASGQYVMPGLAEMHAHLPGEDDEEFREAVLFLFAANGVTFARGMQGAPDHPALRDAIAAGERFGPTLRVASPGFSGAELTEEEARERVRTYHEQGFDLLKIFEGLRPEVYEAIADEAKSVGIPFAGHVSDDVGLLRSLEEGHQTIDHLDNYVEALRTEEAPDDFGSIFGAASLVPHLDRERIPEVVEATQEAGAGVVPTMVLWEAFFDDTSTEVYREELPELEYLPDGMIEDWENGLQNIREGFDPEQGQEVIALRREILQALHEADVPILLGSDAPQIFNVPGFSVHREMQYMQDEVGMSPYEVLVSGTRAVAEFYDAGDTFGTVEEGKRADLILVNDNPLDDVAHAADIAGVVVQGRWLSADDIQARLDELAEQLAGE